MKNTIIFLALIALCFSATSASADVVVSNVQAEQEEHPSKWVVVTYDVESDAELLRITLEISNDGGETWDVPVRTVEGDAGREIEPGEGKTIRWDAGSDYPDIINDRMRAKVTAREQGEEPEPGEERVFELADGVEIVMCWIPSGEFQMGSPNDEDDRNDDEGPVHRVTLENGFWMGKYEITQGQWEAVMGDNPARNCGVGDDYPVYYVSWDDIQDFEERLNDGFRLPSEAEWEYACRAGTDTRFYWGDDPDYEAIDDYAVYRDNDPGGTAEVGTKRPNGWGLHDMSGNVYEWCEDLWHGNYNGAPENGGAWVDGGDQGRRVLRGGSWSGLPNDCRSANRGNNGPSGTSGSVGFRVVFSY